MHNAPAAVALALAVAASTCGGAWLPSAPRIGGVADWIESFGAMIRCKTGGSKFRALRYNGYGCWCGKGHKPLVDRYPDFSVDAIDQACQAHDRCYDGKGLKKGGACDPNRYLTGSPRFDAYSIDCVGGRSARFKSRHRVGSRGDICSRRQHDCDLAFANTVKAYKPPRRKPKCPKCIYRTSLTKHYKMEPGVKYAKGGQCLQCDASGQLYDCTTCCAKTWNGINCSGNCNKAGYTDSASGGCNTWTGGHSCYTCYPNGKWAPGCKGLCRFCRLS